MKIYRNTFAQIADVHTLFSAWEKFKKGKGSKLDVCEFERNLEQNIFRLRRLLINKQYKHSPYTSFYIQDPKQRHIHKATVADRIVHHAVYSVLMPLFEPVFISHSFSCRINKGTHKGIDALGKMLRSVSQNYTTPCFVLKCDVRRFFESIDHSILLTILARRIKDPDTLWLLEEIIESHFSPALSLFSRKGLPIGNLTSQLFANVYLHELDQYVKHSLGIKHYARYTDDFVIVGKTKQELQNLITPINSFLQSELSLDLHPSKVTIRKLGNGVDFLGMVLFPHHRVLRTKTRRRMFRKMKLKLKAYDAGKVSEDRLQQTLQSYLGMLSHVHGHKQRNLLLNQFWLSKKG